MNPREPIKANELSHPKYRPDIDGLRAIAVLAVVGFHAVPNWLRGGYIGVDIFFVISGFLISMIIFQNLETNTFSFTNFYARRVKRIFPALLIVLVSCYVVGWFILLADDYKQLGLHIISGAGFVSNLTLWREVGYFDATAETKPLLHLWSLGIEEQFYLFWPIIAWLAWKKKLNFITVSVVLTAISFALNIAALNTDATAAFYSPLNRFWELLCGSILAYTGRPSSSDGLSKIIFRGLQPEKGTSLNNIKSLIGIGMILIGFTILSSSTKFPGAWALLPTVGTSLIIAAGHKAWFNRNVLSNRYLVFIGLISYPIYLWHWPLLSFARIIATGTPSRNVRVLAVITSIFLAWATYRLVERPIRKHIDSKKLTGYLSILMLAIGFIGYNSYLRNGLAFRFPKVIQEITTFHYDYKTGYRGGTCFLDPEQDYRKFADCGFPPKKSLSTFMIWGDSHAAHLYPGYANVYGQKVNLIQRTASACPPIMNLELSYREHCKEINDHNLDLAVKAKPDRVILAAYWSKYQWEKVNETIVKLREIGINNIDLIGPAIYWQGPLSKQVYQSFLKDKLHGIPKRIPLNDNEEIAALDSAMEQFARREHINYISPYKILCISGACLAMVGETADSILAWDYGHLTERGSTYLVNRFDHVHTK